MQALCYDRTLRGVHFSACVTDSEALLILGLFVTVRYATLCRPLLSWNFGKRRIISLTDSLDASMQLHLEASADCYCSAHVGLVYSVLVSVILFSFHVLACSLGRATGQSCTWTATHMLSWDAER